MDDLGLPLFVETPISILAIQTDGFFSLAMTEDLGYHPSSAATDTAW